CLIFRKICELKELIKAFYKIKIKERTTVIKIKTEFDLKNLLCNINNDISSYLDDDYQCFLF
ncbi:hypothetical protein, partial [Lactobacillus taiwanensis]|uniref:hypothetical protein n=1 Tax=Lactobacillus taiwanensis TaxID=508451 RepID=UPI001C532CC5